MAVSGQHQAVRALVQQTQGLSKIDIHGIVKFLRVVTSPLQYLLAAVPSVLQYYGKLHFKLGTRMWIWLNCTGDVKYWYCILSFLLLQQILEEKVFAGELIKTWKSSLWFHSMTLLFLIWYLAGSLSSPDNSDSLPTWGRWIWEKWNYLSRKIFPPLSLGRYRKGVSTEWQLS